ncbi:hypothetical protein V8E36_009566 [Tilletia maclaganii]
MASTSAAAARTTSRLPCALSQRTPSSSSFSCSQAVAGPSSARTISSSASASTPARDSIRSLSHTAATLQSSSSSLRAALAHATSSGFKPASEDATTLTGAFNAPRRHPRSAIASDPSPQSRSPFEPSTRALTPIPDLPSLRAWFASHFPALALPDNVILQLITHESHNMGRNLNHSSQSSADVLSAGAHNRRLAFLGRRALTAFLALFLHGLSAGLATGSNAEVKRAADELLRSPDALDVILHTGRMGDRPGRALRLDEVMRWTPAATDSGSTAHERGLFTIRGRALEAFIGAIYHQHGANLASQIFHVHVLPNIDAFPPSTPRALWDAIRARADVDQDALTKLEPWAAQQRTSLGYQPPAERP